MQVHFLICIQTKLKTSMLFSYHFHKIWGFVNLQPSFLVIDDFWVYKLILALAFIFIIFLN